MKKLLLILILSTLILPFQGRISQARHTKIEAENYGLKFSIGRRSDLSKPFYSRYPGGSNIIKRGGRIGKKTHGNTRLRQLWMHDAFSLPAKNQHHQREQEATKLTLSPTAKKEGEKIADQELNLGTKPVNKPIIVLSDEQKKLQILHAWNILNCLKKHENFTLYARLLARSNNDPIFSDGNLNPLLNIVWRKFFLSVKRKSSHHRPYQPIPFFSSRELTSI